jgi:hypothetical protein
VSTVLHILPRRSVVPDGIGDYATRLAEGLRQHCAIESVFLQATGSERAEPRRDGWPTQALAGPSPETFAAHVSRMAAEYGARTLLLHVSGYGYHKRGAPQWLVKGIAAARATVPSAQLIGFFHELWVERHYRPWRSSFWLRGQQQLVTRALFGMCDRAITSTGLYKHMLEATPEAPGKRPVERMAVFSNVGEPQNPVPHDMRPSHMAVFTAGGVGELLGSQPVALRGLLSAARISAIHDIGARSSVSPQDVFGVPVVATGRLAANAVSEVLSRCRYGAIRYESLAKLGKSGAFAAYAAHGIVPVVFDPVGRSADGLVAGRHYVVPGATFPTNLGAIAEDLRRWYASHAIVRHAETIGAMIRSPQAMAA